LERSSDGWGEQEVQTMRDEEGTREYKQKDSKYNLTK
jgi:hypothetical protein